MIAESSTADVIDDLSPGRSETLLDNLQRFPQINLFWQLMDLQDCLVFLSFLALQRAVARFFSIF